MSSSSQLFMSVGSESTKASVTSELAGAPAKSNRGRKPSAKAKSGGPKKPQRGLGVEQLERLRLQERWKKMTEMPSPSALAPLESVPVQYGAGGYSGAAGRLVLGSPGVAADHGSGLMDPRFLPHHHHLHLHHHDSHVHDHQYQRVRVDDPFDISSFKKKRFSGEINGPCSSTFYGLNNPENDINHSMNMNGDHLTLGFATPNTKIPRNSQEGDQVEVMAVHRKGFSHDHQDHLVMEYKFFPGQGGGKKDIVSTSSSLSSSSGTNFKKIWPSELEASYFTNNVGADSCNNPLDLSLKL